MDKLLSVARQGSDINNTSLLDIRIKGKRLSYEISLKDRLTILVGDSGTGKTTLVDMLLNEDDIYNVSLSKKYNVAELLKSNYKALLNDAINGVEYLFVIDDKDFMYTSEFASLYGNVTNSLFIFICRTESDKFKKWNTIPFSANAIYKLEHKFGVNVLTPKFTYSYITNMIKDFVVITEDRKSGYQLACELFNTVYHADSKDKLLQYIKENKELFINRNVLLFVDIPAIGFILSNVIKYLTMLHSYCFVIKDMQSVEYLILRSKFYNKNIDLCGSDMIEYITIERYCTDILEQLSLGKPYTYSKSKLNNCYTTNCCTKDRKDNICDKGISGDKLKYLFSGTDFEYLLNFKER